MRAGPPLTDMASSCCFTKLELGLILGSETVFQRMSYSRSEALARYLKSQKSAPCILV